jgi:aspartyl-tRNA(Asn)/glutamyl-tRNA(Gln) amidotransferase subunit A
MSGFRETMRHSQWLNLAGLPGLSVPITMSREGLPIGVQLIGRPNEEEHLFTIAESLELARGPWQHPPLLWT